MKTVTQKARYRQAIIKYAEKYGVTKAANRYDVNRQYIYRWKKRYDGSLESLVDKSHRPYSHPNQHTEEELKLISDMRRRNLNAGLVVFWVKLQQRGYTRSITGLYRVLRKTGLQQQKLPNPKYIPSDAKVYIDGKEAAVSGSTYSVKFGQLTSSKNVSVEVKQGDKVLDSSTLKINVNSTFFGKLASFFSNFPVNLFKRKEITVNF